MVSNAPGLHGGLLHVEAVVRLDGVRVPVPAYTQCRLRGKVKGRHIEVFGVLREVLVALPELGALAAAEHHLWAVLAQPRGWREAHMTSLEHGTHKTEPRFTQPVT